MLDYRIEACPAFQLIGKPLRVSIKSGENLTRIPQFWQECLSDGTHDRLLEFAAQSAVFPRSTLGVCMDFEGNMEAFTYLIGSEHTSDEVPGGMVVRAVPALTWAVFRCVGAMPEAIQNVWSEIMSGFFETAPYRHREAPDIEVYPPGNAMQADYISEVWVPVKSK